MTTLFDTVTEAPTMLTVSPPCMKGAALTFGWAGFSNGNRVVSASIVDIPGRVGACQYAMCGRYVIGDDVSIAPEHMRDDIIARINRGDFG